MARILIIEHDKVVRTVVCRLLERNGLMTLQAGSLPEAEECYSLHDFDLIISALRLPGPPGTEAIQRASGVPVLIMTGHASVKAAVAAMQQGAADYITKPFDSDELLHSVTRILEKHRLQRQNAALRSELQRAYPVAGIVGDSGAMQRVFDHIRKIAPTDSTVLILGESGTGKELVARALHEHSLRREAPLIAVNCATIPESLLESELFGHARGAFTGAVGARQGLVEAATGGTLFLDEIGELPLLAQARLLRVLQEGEIRRVGASHATTVDVRLIAATHRDMAQLVREGILRSDLYFRLRVMEIALPALRERYGDIIKLAHYMLDKACKKLNRPAMRFSASALDLMQHYSWPGNVREMENAIERAVILNEGQQITPEVLAIGGDPQGLPAGTGSLPELSLDEYFRHFVLSHQDRLTETEIARRLGISRKSLWQRRQRLGIRRPRGKR